MNMFWGVDVALSGAELAGKWSIMSQPDDPMDSATNSLPHKWKKPDA
jgi:hypothetical protein